MNSTLLPKIISEGYCCLHGYLHFCKAKKETNKSMAAWLNVSHWTIAYNYKMYNKGKRPCQKYSDCMIPIIQEVEKGS